MVFRIGGYQYDGGSEEPSLDWCLDVYWRKICLVVNGCGYDDATRKGVHRFRWCVTNNGPILVGMGENNVQTWGTDGSNIGLVFPCQL